MFLIVFRRESLILRNLLQPPIFQVVVEVFKKRYIKSTLKVH